MGERGGGKKGREKNGVCVVCLSKSLFVQMLLSICVCARVCMFSPTQWQPAAVMNRA